MTRQAAAKVYANFTGGLATEAPTLSFPENSATDLSNVDINEDGSIQTRNGLQYTGATEVAFPTLSTTFAETATQVLSWDSVNGDESLNIAVVQIGDRLEFYYVVDEQIIGSLAADPITISAPSRTLVGSTTADRQSSKVQAVSGKGWLFVSGPYCDPFVLTFTGDGVNKGSVSRTSLVLKIRDFSIFEEGLSTTLPSLGTFTLDGSERQTEMSGAHFYNLANQGWPSEVNGSGFYTEVTSTVMDDQNPNGNALQQLAAAWTLHRVNFYPTIAHVYHAYQNGGGSDIDRQVAYQPFLLQNDYTGNSPSPRGKIILEAFYKERKAVGYCSIPDTFGSAYANFRTYNEIERSNTRPTSVAYYAGRIWYAGLESSAFANNVYFSQILTDRIETAEKCYQEADPTAEVINELVDTDGGVIGLEGVGKILKITTVGVGLLVIADNGSWIIAGDGEQTSFKATSFTVRKITNRGCLNVDSIVTAKDSIFYWSNSSAIVISQDEAGFLVATDVTTQKIKTLYGEIVSNSRDACFSVYDEGADRVLWFYRKDLPDTLQQTTFTPKSFNKVLVLDLGLNAFYKYDLTLSPQDLPVSAISVETVGSLVVAEGVYDGGVIVTDSGEDVEVSTTITNTDRSSIKILTLSSVNPFTSVYKVSGFIESADYEDFGNPIDSFVETGFDALSDVLNKTKMAPIVQTHLRRTEQVVDIDTDTGQLAVVNPSSCFMSYGWDWKTNLSNPIDIYRLNKNYTPATAGESFDYGQDVISTRNRIRGRGTSLGLKFNATAGMGFHLLGYSVLYTVGTRV